MTRCTDFLNVASMECIRTLLNDPYTKFPHDASGLKLYTLHYEAVGPPQQG